MGGSHDEGEDCIAERKQKFGCHYHPDLRHK
jgi:hypothetical protein